MTATTNQPTQAEVVFCVKCGQENDIESNRCHDCKSHLYVSCKRCGCQNLRSSERCNDCRTQLHQRGKFKWKHAKACKWIQTATYALVAIGSIATCWGVVKITQIDFSRPDAEPVYIHVDEEMLERIQSQ